IAMMNCQPEGRPPHVPAYLMMLGAPPSVLSSTMTATRAPVPQSPPTPPSSMPPRATDDAVVVVKRGLGFNARVAVAAAVLAVIVIVVLFLVNRSGPDDALSASRTQRLDTVSQASGDIDRRSRGETTAFVARPPQAAQAVPQPTIVPPPARDTMSATSRSARGDSMLAAPDQRRREPGTSTTPALTMPN